MKTLIIITSIFISLFIIFVSMFIAEHHKNKILNGKLNYYNKTILKKQGSTSTYGGGQLGKDFINYNLQSWDGGKNWYACEYDSEWGIKILGLAEDIYPGLLKHLEAWDELTDYVIKNGPIGSNGISKKDIKILTNAGFEISKKK